jgi:hypothetical protein
MQALQGSFLVCNTQTLRYMDCFFFNNYIAWKREGMTKAYNESAHLQIFKSGKRYDLKETQKADL